MTGTTTTYFSHSMGYEGEGIIKTVSYPIMEVRLNKGWDEKNLQGRTLRLIKERPSDHNCNSEECSPPTISIILIGPAKEGSAFKEEFKEIASSPCEEVSSFNGAIKFHCKDKTALLALEMVTSVFKDRFGACSTQWFSSAKEFVTGDQTVTEKIVELKWPTDLEAQIRSKMRNQGGAMDLVEALKKLPYSSDVKRILERLERGAYGEFSSDSISPSSRLSGDLQRRGFAELAKLAAIGKFEHDGPPRIANEKNAKTLQYIIQNMGKPMSKW